MDGWKEGRQGGWKEDEKDGRISMGGGMRRRRKRIGRGGRKIEITIIKSGLSYLSLFR